MPPLLSKKHRIMLATLSLGSVWELSRAFGHVTGTFFDQCHGHVWNITGYFFQKKSRARFTGNRRLLKKCHGIFKNCHGQKNNCNKISIEKRAAPKAREKNWSPKCHGHNFWFLSRAFFFVTANFVTGIKKLSRAFFAVEIVTGISAHFARILNRCHGHSRKCYGKKKHYLR